MKKLRFTPRMLSVMGVLIALEIVIAQFITFRPSQSIKLSLDFIPIVIAGILYGPLPALIISVLADILGAFLFPVGPYFPGFTVTAALTGLLYGALLREKQTMPRAAAAVGVQQWGLSLGLNNFWLHVLYGMPYLATLLGRLVQVAIMTVIQILFIPVIARTLQAVGKRARI